METLNTIPTGQISNNPPPNPELAVPDRPPSSAEPPPSSVVLSAPDTSASALPANPETPVPVAPPPITLPPALKPKAPIPRDLGIGTADLRTPAEDIQFHECELIIGGAWRHFARAGEALTTIRDKELFKNEYDGFEQYCRQRWGLGDRQVRRLIAGAEVHKTLATLPDIALPDSEAQVRPLVGLPAEVAQQAWLHALSWGRDGYVSARQVTRAVRQVQKVEQPGAVARAHADVKQRSRLRESVRTGFAELLTLLLGTAERPVLIAKVQEIQRLLDPLLTRKKTNR